MRVLVVGEDDLSHGSLARRLAASLGEQPGVEADLRLVGAPNRFEALALRRVGPLGDLDLQPLRWRARYSLHARRLLAAAPADAALVNTQACALFAAGPMRRVPTVLSVDSTHRQFAGLEYWRPRGRASRIGEVPLDALERRAYRHAARVMAWTEWTARSLREDYGVPGARVAVLHPGVDLPPPRAAPPDGGPLRLLFVGNGVRRKGLPELLAAARATGAELRIDVVTADTDVPVDPLVEVHRGVAPGDERHRALFAGAHAFAFPTTADAAPWAVVEALAAGLPVVATDVGAIRELVGDGGIVVGRGDDRALAGALGRLAGDAALRAELSARARTRAEREYDAARQVPRLVELLRGAS